jgi:hypothetical protein
MGASKYMKNIVFRPIKDFTSVAIPPKPAKTQIPNWYKKMETDIPRPDQIDSFTSKRCMPLLDGMTAGYHLFSYADVKVSVKDGCTKINWTHSSEVIAVHPREQVPGMPLPVGYYKDEAFKWFNPVSIQTPKGYSTLFVTPMLRHELPFFCFPAIVDTDTYTAAVHFPFLMKKNFEGVIPRETPIIQAIPFKRDDWKHEWQEDPVDNDSAISYLKTFIHSSYKKTNWNKKYFN